MSKASDPPVFQVSGAMTFFSWWICEHPRFWRGVGNLETSMVQEVVDDTPVHAPIYVAGLARSGSTILLEMLADTPGITTHRYKDFPPVFTPYAWNRLLGYMSSGDYEPAERAHKDGILVTPDSPEAMEEPLWMAFFPDLHNPATNNRLDRDTPDNGFAAFYGEHIRKLLAVRGAQRYLSKGNYNLSRLAWLHQQSPDARFVLPVRHPENHIASLMKQHELFIRGQEESARARAHLRRVGHFEFGLDRQPINMGDSDVVSSIVKLWETGEEIRGWARYWNHLYAAVLKQLEADPALRDASRVVRYEDLCAAPAQELTAIFRHCKVAPDEKRIAEQAARIKAPDYYQTRFTAVEQAVIAEETAEARALLDY